MRAIMQSGKLRAAECGLNRNACGPDTFGKQRSRDVRSFSGSLTTIECSDNRRIETDRSCVVAATTDGPGRWVAGIARHREQAAASPVRSDVEARQVSIRSFIAETGEVRIDEPRVPVHDIFVFELQFF